VVEEIAKATKVVDGEGDEGDLVLIEGVDDIMSGGFGIVASMEFAVNAVKMGLMAI
jgi:hypothetical protein